MRHPRPDRGSFRDRDGRVFLHQGRVLRALGPRGLESFRAFEASRLFGAATADGRLVATRELPAAEAEERLRELDGSWAGMLEHEPIPFLSYPYEWPFGMLREAAVLQLELLRDALAEGLVLKDASPYNVQWRGARPTFIDVGSFEPWREGDPWVGYLQFCPLYLSPLMLTAYRGLPHQPWLRGAIDGIEPEAAWAAMGLRDLLRPGVLADVYLQARLQRAADASQASLRTDLRRAGFKKELIVHNVERLLKVVRKLRWRRESSEWVGYAEENSYDAAGREAKESFVRRAVEAARPGLVWDLGANTGVFSRLAAEHAGYVVAIDGDPLAVERLYHHLRAEGPENVLPLVVPLHDPSPSLGWRLAERRSLEERGRPDMVFALALLHHLVITANVPLPEVIEHLAGLGGTLVVEWVSKEDPMVRRLLRNKEDLYDDYTPEVFESCLERAYEVVRREPLPSGTRTLYLARLRRS